MGNAEIDCACDEVGEAFGGKVRLVKGDKKAFSVFKHLEQGITDPFNACLFKRVKNERGGGNNKGCANGNDGNAKGMRVQGCSLIAYA